MSTKASVRSSWEFVKIKNDFYLEAKIGIQHMITKWCAHAEKQYAYSDLNNLLNT